MRVFVTGGTGFVGRKVVRALAAEHRVVALVRPESQDKLPKHPNIEAYPGDLTDPVGLPAGLQGCDAVVHLVGIIREFPERGVTFQRLHVEATCHLLDIAGTMGVRRFLHMSANGVRERSRTDYHRTKWLAEEAVRSSALPWTIIRPSLIFGAGSAFVGTLARLLRLPVVPVIGDGSYRLQPVDVAQVAQTFLKALSMPQTVHGVYHLGGAKSYAYDEILDLTGRALGRVRVRKIHQPPILVRPVVALLESFSGFPITLDQMSMLLEGNVCDPRPWADTFGITPVAYEDGVRACFQKRT